MFVNLLRINSILVATIGGAMVLPLITSLVYKESLQLILSFLGPFVVSFVVLAAVNIPLRKRKIELNIRTSYIAVAFAWIFSSLMGALPYFISETTPTFTDAVFESVSGFSTTGSTIYSDLESLPHSINLWRCLTHWLGGMGIVALTVALLPLLGIGGFQLIKAETTGPEKGKVTDKITTTAKILWFIYFVLTLLEAILLKIAGMSFFDAICHAFSTLGTGGFSTKNASIAAFDSAAIDIIITVFMFLAGINFSLYFFAVTGNFGEIFKNSELKAYIGIVFFCVLGATIPLVKESGGFFHALRYSAFQIISVGSTTGFSTQDFTLWPSASQFFILLLFFVGGSSGSTSGGFKVIRWVVLFKQVKNEIKKMLHPHGVFSLRLNKQARDTEIVTVVTSFTIVFFFLVAITTFIGCLAKLDIFTAFTTAVSMVGNIGPGFGGLGPSFNFGFLPPALKWWYCFTMLAGRLELYTMIMLLLPTFWKNR